MNAPLLNSVLTPPIPAFKSKCRELVPRGGRTFDMSQAIPSFPTFPAIREQLARHLGTDELSFYTEVPGLLELREAIASGHWAKSHIDPDRLLITAGANQAMFTALLTLLNAGDTVLLLEPYYFNYDMALPMLGLTADYLPLSEASGLQLDADSVIKRLDCNPSIRAVILITPNNPSGSCYAASEVMKLLNGARTRGVEVIIDETYLKFDPNHLNHPNLASHLGDGLTVIGSFSKSYSLTGYRVGYLLAGTEFVKQALKVQDTLIICPSHIGQLAALAGIRHCDADVRQEANRVSEVAELVWSHAKTWSSFQLVSCGAFFAYVKHPWTGLNSTEAGLRLYQETGILCLPGEVFGRSQAAYLRLSISNLSESDIRAAMASLRQFDASLSEEIL